MGSNRSNSGGSDAALVDDMPKDFFVAKIQDTTNWTETHKAEKHKKQKKQKQRLRCMLLFFTHDGARIP